MKSNFAHGCPAIHLIPRASIVSLGASIVRGRSPGRSTSGSISAVLLLLGLALPPTGLSQSCVPTVSGLVSWWAGDGSADDAVGGNPATLQNGTTFAAGEVDQAFSLDGVANYVSISPSPSLDVGLGNGLTIECWIRPDDLSQQHILAEWNDGAGHVGAQLQISIPQLGGLGSIFANMLDTSGADHYLATAPNVLSVGVFQHVAVTYDKTTGDAKLFYNGAILASANLGVFTPQTTYGLYFGTRISGPGTGSYFKGLLDEVSLYDRALTDAEILDIANAGIAGKCGIMTPPAILSQPASQTVHVGANVTFAVRAKGPSLSYQWRSNGVEIASATNSSLVMSSVQTNQAGNYSVTVTNLYGSVTSSDAVLVVIGGCISAAPGLVSWWSAEGNADDNFGGNHGILQGGLVFASGEAGQAFNFDGIDDYVSVAASAELNVGVGDGVTIECWIKPGNVSSQHILAEWNDGNGHVGTQLQFSVAALGGLGSLLGNVLDTSGTDHLFTSAPNLITTNSFQHVALTYDKTSGQGKLFRNGIVVASQSLGVFTPQTSYGLYWGKRISGPGTGSYFRGLLDEAAVYNRALTDAEIQTIFNSGSAGKTCISPEIITQPASQTAKPGTNVSFKVGVRGGLPLNYQWRLNGANLTGATNASLTLSNVQPSNVGNYSVRITNSLGNATSSNALLKVTVILAFGNGQPLTNAQYSFGGPVTVQLTNLFPTGPMFYTLDGSTPTISSAQYNGPFAVTHSVILRVLGYSPDFFQTGELDPPVTILIVPTYSLAATSAGGGTVTLSPTGGLYLSNTVVNLNANPAPGWMFLQWLGDATGANPVTNVTVTRNKFVQAVFGTSFSTTAAGNGSVTLNPPGGVYPYGTVVRLSAIPLPGNYFGLWGNAASGNVNPLNFLVTNANLVVSSLFGSVSAGQAALTVVPLGKGQANVNPRANIYNVNQSVSITATPDSGQSFLGWSGDAVGTQNPLPLLLDQSKLIYANFTAKPTLIVRSLTDGLKAEGFQLTLTGDFGVRNEIDASSNLVNWTALTTLTNPFGTIQFLDSAATNLSRRFYRALVVP